MQILDWRSAQGYIHHWKQENYCYLALCLSDIRFWRSRCKRGHDLEISNACMEKWSFYIVYNVDRDKAYKELMACETLEQAALFEMDTDRIVANPHRRFSAPAVCKELGKLQTALNTCFQ